MVNHVRNLLLNQASRSRPPLGWFGEEYIDPAYVPAPETDATRALRATLFGSASDELTQNYRLSQYLHLLGSVPACAPYLVAADSRRTDTGPSGLLEGPWGVQLEQQPGPLATLRVVPTFQGNDTLGQNYNQFWFQLDAITHQFTLTVARPQVATYSGTATPTANGSYTDFTVPVPGLDLSLVLSTTGTVYPSGGHSVHDYRVQITSRPARTLPQILQQVLAVGQVLDRLWGSDRDREPYRSFRNLVETGSHSTQQLGGVLLGLAWRTEQQGAR